MPCTVSFGGFLINVVGTGQTDSVNISLSDFVDSRQAHIEDKNHPEAEGFVRPFSVRSPGFKGLSLASALIV